MMCMLVCLVRGSKETGGLRQSPIILSLNPTFNGRGLGVGLSVSCDWLIPFMTLVVIVCANRAMDLSKSGTRASNKPH